jgi:hypothetical protein
MNQNMPFYNISLQNISNTSNFNVSLNNTFTNSPLNTTPSLSNYTAPKNASSRFGAPSPEENSTTKSTFGAPSPEENSTTKSTFGAPSPSRFRAPKVDSMTPSPFYIMTNYSSVIENNVSLPNNDTLTEKHQESLIAIPIIIGSMVLIIGLIFLLFKRKNKKNRVGCVSLKNNGKKYKVPKKTIFIGRPRDDIGQFAPPDTPTTQQITPHPPLKKPPRKHKRSLPPLPLQPSQKEEELIVEP